MAEIAQCATTEHACQFDERAVQRRRLYDQQNQSDESQSGKEVSKASIRSRGHGKSVACIPVTGQRSGPSKHQNSQANGNRGDDEPRHAGSMKQPDNCEHAHGGHAHGDDAADMADYARDSLWYFVVGHFTHRQL
jgi:hypothetical protein